MNLCWFRNDLRLSDNPALQSALSNGFTYAVFILEKNSAQRQLGAASKAWLHHSLKKLAQDLAALGIPFVVKQGDPVTEISMLVADLNVEGVYWNRRYQPDDVAIDKAIKSNLIRDGKLVESYKANLLFEPWEIVSAGEKTPYRVFTPFWKVAVKKGVQSTSLGVPTPQKHTSLDLKSCLSSIESLNLSPKSPDWSEGFWKRWDVGEKAANSRLDEFLNNRLSDYSEGRDIPSLFKTSGLSPHLRFGEISPRQIWHAVHAKAGGDISSNDYKFLSEVGWREFSHSILFHADNLAEKNWKPDFDAFPWTLDFDKLDAWKKGQTGYPLVDAGMRELWHTGYMHNRVRMVTASFLIKHLKIDWREGEKWFWDTLLDACPANNPASWQWVAGSGADASPFFRIFNPIAQSEKFDADGKYIKKWVPELSKLNSKWVHKPWQAPPLELQAAGVELDKTYPAPIVDHTQARGAAMEAYNAMKALNA